MIIKCDKGHWYDSSVNRACPHCKKESEQLSIRLNDVEEDDKTISFAEAGLSLGDELSAIIGNSMGNSAGDSMGGIFGGTLESSDEDSDKTVSFGFWGVQKTEPVTGWLVCISGEEKGKDYRLHASKNFVGRGTGMDVQLVDDKKIARQKHCSLIYEPKENVFFAAPESGNITYLNGNLLEVPDRVNDGDIIKIGDTELMFVAFCKEGRRSLCRFWMRWRVFMKRRSSTEILVRGTSFIRMIENRI